MTDIVAKSETYDPASTSIVKLAKTELLGAGFSCLIKLLDLTLRYQYFHEGNRREAERAHSKGSFCSGLWQQNSLASMLAHKNMNIRPLVSYNFHGDTISRVLSKFGFTSVRGGPAKGGKEALRIIYKQIPSGCRVALTVDGPKGPRHEVKAGVVAVAANKNLPILPIAAVADRYWELRTWDRMRLPKPFSKVRVMYGKPIYIDQEGGAADFEQAKIKVSQALHRIERQLARFRIY